MMNRNALAMPVLHAVGLPARSNEEFVIEAISAIASWKRWSHEGASKWLMARARAAQDAGVKVDKWYFVNGDYRDDPRPRDVRTNTTLGHPNCPKCRGLGWQIVTRALADGVTMRDFAVRCECKVGGGIESKAGTAPEIGALSNAKSMDTIFPSAHSRNASGTSGRVAGPNQCTASARAEHEHQLHQRGRQPNH